MEFRVLGSVEATGAEGPLALGAPKRRALLALLLLHANTVVSRDRLVDALWGEEPPRSAVSSLQVYVHGLRRALGAERIEREIAPALEQGQRDRGGGLGDGVGHRLGSPG